MFVESWTCTYYLGNKLTMPFPFTFSFTVPGLSNPFSKPTSQNPVMSAGKHKITRPRPSPSPIPLGPLSAAAPTSRKRGWEPAFVEPSLSMTTLASSSGYLDTPAKYREMALASGGASHVDELHEAHIIASDIGVYPLASPFMHALHVPSGKYKTLDTSPSNSVPYIPIHSFTFFFFFFGLSTNVLPSSPPSPNLFLLQVH